MKRSRKIVVLSHCLLNGNSKIRGGAIYGTILEPVLEFIVAQKAGIIQLPCPEHSFSGEARWGKSKAQYDSPFFRNHCQNVLRLVVDGLLDYQNNNYQLLGVLGISGSPSCGVFETFQADWGGEINDCLTSSTMKSGRMVEEPGVFIEVFQAMLAEKGLSLFFTDVKEGDMPGTMEVLKKMFQQE